jgi:hypothetical protein
MKKYMLASAALLMITLWAPGTAPGADPRGDLVAAPQADPGTDPAAGAAAPKEKTFVRQAVRCDDLRPDSPETTKGKAYVLINAQLAKSGVTFTDYHWRNKNGLFKYRDDQKPGVAIHKPKGWPASWNIKATVTTTSSRNEYEYHSDDKLFYVHFELKNTAGPLVHFGKQSSGNNLSWMKIYRIRADGTLPRYREGSGR